MNMRESERDIEEKEEIRNELGSDVDEGTSS